MKNSDISNAGRLPFWYWLLIPAVFFLFQFVSMQSQPLAYSDFKRLLHAGKVNELTVAEETISGALKAGGLDAVMPTQEVEQLKCTPARGCPLTTAGCTIRI